MKRIPGKKSMPKKIGGKLPKEKGHVYLLRGIPDGLWRAAKAYAGQNGTTVREVILTALRKVTK